jgi:hypothetical protein
MKQFVKVVYSELGDTASEFRPASSQIHMSFTAIKKKAPNSMLFLLMKFCFFAL